MAFELLSGTTPWVKRDLMSLVAAIMTESPPLLRDRNPEIPIEVANAIARALSREPDARFGAINDRVEALSPFAEPPNAVQKSARQEPNKAVRDLLRPETTTETTASVVGAGQRKRAWGLPVTVAAIAVFALLWFTKPSTDLQDAYTVRSSGSHDAGLSDASVPEASADSQ